MSIQFNNLKFPKETQLIIECSHAKLSVEQIENISKILHNTLDWEYIIRISRRNGILPLLSRNLTQKFNSLLPEDIKITLNDILQTHIKRNMFMTKELIVIVKAFKEKNISILPYKGPLLSIQAYGDLTLRHFGDLDILVTADQVKLSLELLKSLNYHTVTAQHWLDDIDKCLKKKKDIGLSNSGGDVYLELHWRLAKPYFDMPIKVSKLFKQSEKIEVAGLKIDTFSFNHLLIYLCLHGSKHAWERLAWICDINELIQSKDFIEWNQLFTEAKNLGCEKVLRFGLLLSDKIFGGGKVLETKHKEAINIEFGEMVNAVTTRIFDDILINFEIGDNYAYQLKLKERFLDRCKLHLYYAQRYLEVIFSPNEADEEVFHLPKKLNALYYFARPVRLFTNYISSFITKR